MYQELIDGTEYEYFTEEVADGLINGIYKEITDTIVKLKGIFQKDMLGCCLTKNAPLKNGGTINVWFEFYIRKVTNLKQFPFPLPPNLANLPIPKIALDCGISKFAIFDETPNFILDKYNDYINGHDQVFPNEAPKTPVKKQKISKEVKLTDKQKFVIEVLRRYPKDMIMFNGWITGGHGVKFDMRTVESLKRKGIIKDGKLVNIPLSVLTQ